METYEDIQAMLELDGEELTFSWGSIFASKGSSTNLLRQEPSLSVVEEQEFNFYVSTEDCVINVISEDDEFTTTDDIYTYSFIVARNPISFTDGWSRLPVTLLSKTLL